jgi:site-specific DNA-cytosine methylase
MRKLNVLELFAGSRSIGNVADYLGMNVFSVDWQPFDKINLVGDIGKMIIKDVPFIPDFIWASPDCTTYSIAGISHHRNGCTPISDYAKQCDQTNKHFIELIMQWKEINPNLIFFIENPRGMMRKMNFVKPFRNETVWYCAYGDNRAKPTDLFTNSTTWKPRMKCWNNNPFCHHEAAPRGSQTGTQGRNKTFDRSKIPSQLCFEVLNDFVENFTFENQLTLEL